MKVVQNPSDSPLKSQPVNARGLENAIGENNCFLNSVLQALFRVDCFREEVLKSAREPGAGAMLCALGPLFGLLGERGPPACARDARLLLAAQFPRNSMADASEALLRLLEALPADNNNILANSQTLTDCPALELFRCNLISSQSQSSQSQSSQSLFMHPVSAFEITRRARNSWNARKDKSMFGDLLRECLQEQSEKENEKENVKDIKENKDEKDNRGCVCVCVRAPECLCVSVGWTEDPAPAELELFLALLETNLPLNQIYPVVEDSENNASVYVLKSMVCFYGGHYVCIAREIPSSTSTPPRFLLADDSLLRALGSWGEVKAELLLAKYRPVALLFEKNHSLSLLNSLTNSTSNTTSRSGEVSGEVSEEVREVIEQIRCEPEVVFAKQCAEDDIRIRKELKLFEEEEELTDEYKKLMVTKGKDLPLLSGKENDIDINLNNINNLNNNVNNDNVSKKSDEDKEREKSELKKLYSESQGDVVVNFKFASPRSPRSPRSQESTSSKNQDTASKSQELLSVFSQKIGMYSVALAPVRYKGRNMLGLELEQMCEKGSGGRILVTGFSRHPLTGERLPAELSARVRILDEVVIAGGLSLLSGDAVGNWQNLIDAIAAVEEGGELKMTFRRERDQENNENRDRDINGVIQNGDGESRDEFISGDDGETEERGREEEEAVLYDAKRGVMMRGKEKEAVKEVVKAVKEVENEVVLRPLRYSVMLSMQKPSAANGGKSSFGLLLQATSDGRLIVTGCKGPAADCTTGEARSIGLLDELEMVDGERLHSEKRDVRAAWVVVERALGGGANRSSSVKLTLLSHSRREAWLTCRHCRHKTVVDDQLRTERIIANKNKLENMSIRCRTCNNYFFFPSGLPSLVDA